MAIKYIIVLFVETPRKFITAIQILQSGVCHFKTSHYVTILTSKSARLVPSRFYKSGRAARSGRVEAHGKGERRNFSDWQITVIFLARKYFSCKLIFYASNLDFLTLVYINRSFYDVVSAKCVFLSSISAFNWSSLEYFKMADSDELRWWV